MCLATEMISESLSLAIQSCIYFAVHTHGCVQRLLPKALFGSQAFHKKVGQISESLSLSMSEPEQA